MSYLIQDYIIRSAKRLSKCVYIFREKISNNIKSKYNT